MQIYKKDPSLNYEEKRAVKWFLILFYTVFILFDIFYFYYYPKYILHQPYGFGENNLIYFYYVLVLLLLPMMLLVIKKGKIFLVKYFFFLGFTFLTVINDIVTFFGSGLEYKSGNIVEVFLILFAPIFVSTLYFWTVALGSIFKYIFMGLLLQTTEVLFPITLLIALSLLGFILLQRFKGYVEAIKMSFDNQLSGIVKGVIATIELKDPYTRGHSERVAYYANSLAEATGAFSKEDLRLFSYACLLHDIGKVNIPDTILMKPGKLSKEEYEVIKTHPEVGANTIMKVQGLGESIEIIKSHHERWDGQGYPEQLMGEEIPYLARIVSIADAFDAMTSSRSYRSALPVEEAYRRIIEGKGAQFDPKLVDTFKEVFPEWIAFHVNHEKIDDTSVKTNIS